MQYKFDVLVLGSGAAGLSLALRLPPNYNIAVISKDVINENSTFYAQGGIAAVISEEDSFDQHCKDTLVAGAGLCNEKAVRFTIENGPECINWLIENGISFSRKNNKLHLTREGGHSQRRILHAADSTGKELENTLITASRKKNNIKFFERHLAVDLIKQDNRCIGAYIFNEIENQVNSFVASATVIATGGASWVYLYSTSPSVASGDGIAIGARAGCQIENLEFNQFHPTCMYNPKADSFLITEAMRGEGARLLRPDGSRFMPDFDKRAELAPRDIVARAIDHEMKRLGIRYVFLDISFKSAEFIRSHFPNIYKKCLEYGIDITKEAIPVVPAAHYTCGGLKVDLNGCTNIPGLYSIGEASCTGLHGANRLASNSLLECLVFGKAAAHHIAANYRPGENLCDTPPWNDSQANRLCEEAVLLHNWNEIRTIMWNYVGIVRSNDSLTKAKQRISLLKEEIHQYYFAHRINRRLIELRHLAEVAELIVKSALARKQNIGLHYNIDYEANRIKNPSA